MSVDGLYPMVPLNSVVRNIQDLANVPIRTGSNPTVFVRDVHAADKSDLSVNNDDFAVIAIEVVPQATPKRMEQASFDTETAHPTPKLGLGSRRTETIRQNAHRHTSCRGSGHGFLHFPPRRVVPKYVSL